MKYYKYLDTNVDEIELLRILYARMDNFTNKECTYRLRELAEACDERLSMNKDKVKRLLDSMEKRGIITIIEKSDGNKDSRLKITIDNVINK